MTTALEFHDSLWESVASRGGDLVIVLSAYIHESQGEAGVAPGRGYWQSVRLTIRNAIHSEAKISLPADISDGVLVAGSRRYANVVPVPLDQSGECLLSLVLIDSSRHEFRGSWIGIEAFGEREGISQFPGVIKESNG